LENIEIVISRPGLLSLAITRVKGNEVLAREVQDRFGAIRIEGDLFLSIS